MHPVQPLRLILMILIGLSAQGCFLAIEGMDIEPTDLSAIKVGATREEVQRILGEPIASEPTKSGKIATYLYDQGALGAEIDDEDIKVYLGLYGFFWEPILTPIGLIRRHERIKEQRGHLKVIYGPDDTVLEFHEPPSEIEKALEAYRFNEILARAEQGDAEAQFRLALLSSSADERRKWLSLAANQGHAEAQFQLYRRDKPDGKSLTWLCLAANQGHALAQEELGDLHVKGLGKAWREAGLVKLDRVRAYMWYSLAAANGLTRAGSTRDFIDDQMTPAQIAEAKRLAAEWKPGDCGAEGSPTKSAG